MSWLRSFDPASHSDLIQRTRLLLLDTIACAVAGFADLVPQNLARTMATSDGNVRWPGAPRLTVDAAAFAAAVAACWHEACEGLARAHGRPGLHAVPVAVSLGLERKASLGDILQAIIVGYEIGGRAGEAMRIRAGLHVDGTWGLFAAVGAAGTLMKLSEQQMLHALASAACQVPTSLYAPVAAGQTARNTYVGHAASAAIGLCAAAAAGVTAPTTAFALAAQNLGGSGPPQPWTWAPPGEILLLQGYLKPFAAVRHVHYAAKCAMDRRTKMGSETAPIRALRLETYQEAITYCGNRHPATPIQAQFSLTHGTAFALRQGTLGPEAYLPEVFQDHEQLRLEKMIEVVADPQIKGRGARLIVRTDKGEETYQTTSVVGDADRPMTADDVTQKAFNYMKPSLGMETARAIIAAVLDRPLDGRFEFTSA